MEESFLLPVAIDYFALFGFFVLAAFYTLKRGPGVFTALTIALPLTLFASELAEQSGVLGTFFSNISDEPYTQLAAHGVILIALYIFLRAMHRTYGEPATFIQALLTGGAATIMTVLVWGTLPFIQEEIRSLPAFLAQWFVVKYFLLWFAASLGLLYFASTQP